MDNLARSRKPSSKSIYLLHNIHKEKTNMAPSAVETVTEAKPHSHKVHLGQYKDIDNTRVDWDVESGKTGEPPAKVSMHFRASWFSHL